MQQTLSISFLSGFFGGVFVSSFFLIGYEGAALLAVLAAAFLFLWRRQSGETFFLSLGVLLFAASLGVFRYAYFDSRAHTAVLAQSQGMQIRIEGTVITDPEKGERFTRAVLETEGAKVLLTLPHYPEVEYGTRLELGGVLKRPENFSGGESKFDWPVYLAKDNIYFEIFLPEIISAEPGGGFWVKRALFSLKHGYLNNLSRVLPHPESALAGGITVGEKNSLGNELEEKFRQAGLIHIVVLSGYNLTLVASMVLSLLAAFSFPRMVSLAAASVSILLFAVLAGASGAVMRAALMGILVLFARSYGKVYEAKNALIAAAFIMTFINPKSLRFDASFQLSFLATLSLIVFLPKIEKYFSRLPKAFGIKENFLATLSTQTFVTPLLLMQSGAVSLLSLAANMLVLIVTPTAMFLGFFAGLAGFISNTLARVIAWPLYFFLRYQVVIAEFFAKIDLGRLPISEINALWGFILYAFLAILVLAIPQYRAKKA